MDISIHVLREEDDSGDLPCSGRQNVFLSTSSARRTTGEIGTVIIPVKYFYPRPPRGGRHGHLGGRAKADGISIHVLREEDDSKCDGK